VVGVNFNKNIVILSQFMSRKEVFGDVGNMKNIAQMERIGICINSTMTNMGDMQTCTIADVNLFIAVVALTDVEAVEVVGDVVRCPGIHVPASIGVVGVVVVVVEGGGSVHRVLLSGEGMVKATTTAEGIMPNRAADLAHWAVIIRVVVAGVIASSTSSSIATPLIAADASTTTMNAISTVVKVAPPSGRVAVALATAI
jgi:hypothetical protein